MKKINFKPVDYTKAGVYGSADWVEKVKLSEQLLNEFDEMVNRLERRN